MSVARPKFLGIGGCVLQKRAEKTKEDIFKAAEAEFSDKGFYGARMDVIAQNAGANKASIYKYYGDKDNLYKQVFYGVYDRFTIQERRINDNSALDWRERIRWFIRQDFKYLHENPTYVRLLMWENLNHAAVYSERGEVNPKRYVIEALDAIIKEAGKECRPHESVSAVNLLQTIYACGFNYFSNLDTMSNVLNADLSSSERIRERADAVSDMVIAYLGG